MKWKDINKKYDGVLAQLRRASPYEILGVPESASLEEIKLAYRRKLSSTHPDRSSEFMKSTDEEITKLINLAYDELMRKKP
jgi:DnaJ-class molecular chaperone